LTPDLEAVERALGCAIGDRALLDRALTHASFAQENSGDRGNERLEFLGDAVLDLVVARLLYEAHPDWTEGDLTRARAAMVNRAALADCARRVGLGPYLRLGRTEQRSAGEDKDRILADCFEAVLGALYLDAGVDAVRAVVARLFEEPIGQGPVRDPKTEFQEWTHRAFKRTPTYHTARDSGTEDDDERFTVEVRVDDEVWGVGVGRSKRLAERDAARDALSRSADGDA
jgi:ribonuclease-3